MLKDFLSPFENLPIPLPEKKVFQRQYVETKLSDNSETSFDFKSIAPDTGFISWIIGSELNRIPAAMVKSATFAALARRPDEIQLIDINNHSGKGRTCYRVDFIAEKYPQGTPAHEAVRDAIGILSKNLAQWQSVYETLKKVSKKVTFFKYPNVKIPTKNALFVCMNPRRGVLYHLNSKLDQPNNAAIIADMECENVIALGSRLHFHMNNEAYVVEAYRDILMRTQYITEQRSIFLEGSGRIINLVRRADVLAHSKELANPEIGIKKIIAKFADELTAVSWVDCATNSNLLLTTQERDQLKEKAHRIDSGYMRSIKKFFGHKEEQALTVSKNQYIDSILSAFRRDKNEILSAYCNVYGQLEHGFNEAEFVSSCAERDWDQHHKSMDFVFPEYGLLEQACENAETSDKTDKKGPSMGL